VTNLLTSGAEVLSEAGFSTEAISVKGRAALAFEDATVLGFLLAYDDLAHLIDSWARDADAAVASYQFGLRRAGQKAWNAYLVLLTGNEADYTASAALNAIEEDLSGMRKIARAGIANIADLRAALLPLLPLQSAPLLEAVEVAAEIRQRTTELPTRAVDAFLSTADEGVVIQIFEEAS
jgi:hypothetical protein